MTLTKQAFADIIGTSRPTLNKWIHQNRNGIAQYVSADGIDVAIFDDEKWAQYKPAIGEATRTRSGAAADVDDLHAALDEAKQELARVTEERDNLTGEISELKKEIDLLNARIEFNDQEIEFQKHVAEQMQQMAADFKQMADQAQRLQMAQLAALPAPRKHRTPIEFIKDVFGSKKEPDSDQEYHPQG